MIKISYPVTCPCCNSQTSFEGEYLVCSNTLECPAQLVGRLINWIKKLNILEWGEALLERLVQSGKVSNIADIYKLKVSDLSSLERMGEKSAQKCYRILWENSYISLENLIGSLSIPLVGRSTVKLLVSAGFDSLDKLKAANAIDLEKVLGMGPERARSFVQGMKTNEKLISDLLAAGITIKERLVGKLTGKSFCCTGSMETKRADLEKMITDAGGTVKSSVGKDLSYLVINDLLSQSSKAKSAKKFNTPLIDENQLLEMLK